MTMEDVYNTLQDLKYITVQEQPPARPPPGTPIKYLRGRKHSSGIARRALSQPKKDENKDQCVIPTDYKITWNPEEIEAYVTEWKGRDQIKINPRLLKWSPFIVAKVPKTATAVEDPDVANGHALSRLPSKPDSSLALTASLRGAVSESHSNGTSERGVPEKGSVMDAHSASAMEVVDEDLLTNVSETSRKSRSSSSWSKSQRSHSAERKRSVSVVPKRSRLRTLRPRPSTQQTSRRDAKPEAEDNGSSLSEKESEEEEEEDGEDGEDGDGDAVSQSQFRRITRSSGHFESPRTKTTHTTTNHKRRRIETSSSTDTEDADGSSSGLTHRSVSPHMPSPPLPIPPIPPPRRSTRSEKVKPTKKIVNNQVSKKTDVGGRVTRSHPQTAQQEVLVSSPHVNGVSVRKEFERLSVRHTRQAVHTHSETNAECISVNGAAPETPETVEVNMAGIISEKTDSLVMVADNHPTTVIIRNDQIEMFDEEDELGDEDAEGEEDLNPSDDY